MKSNRRIAWKSIFLITPSRIRMIPIITTAKSTKPKIMKPVLIEKYPKNFGPEYSTSSSFSSLLDLVLVYFNSAEASSSCT
jgi:hypothetical protein